MDLDGNLLCSELSTVIKVTVTKLAGNAKCGTRGSLSVRDLRLSLLEDDHEVPGEEMIS